MKEEIPAMNPLRIGSVSEDDGRSSQSLREADHRCKNWFRVGVGVWVSVRFFLNAHLMCQCEARPVQVSSPAGWHKLPSGSDRTSTFTVGYTVETNETTTLEKRQEIRLWSTDSSSLWKGQKPPVLSHELSLSPTGSFLQRASLRYSRKTVGAAKFGKCCPGFQTLSRGYLY